MELTVVSKRGVSSSVISISKQDRKKSLRELVKERTGMDFEACLINNPHDIKTDYVEFGRMGSEKI